MVKLLWRSLDGAFEAVMKGCDVGGEFWQLKLGSLEYGERNK